MFKFVIVSFLVLSLLGSGQCQSCTYYASPTGYLCELSGGNYNNRGDPYTITGDHELGYTNANVSFLVASPSSPPNLRFVPDTIFQTFPNLRAISLSGNNIESAAEIPNCEYLEFLDLSYNKINNIPSVSQCINLQEVSFEGNGAVEVYSNSFEGLSQLHSIWLANNSITNLSPGTFDILPQLKYLELQHNQIQQIPSNLFNQLPHLESVNLGYNAITSISDGSFSNLPSLTTLSLNDNFIPGINSQAFVAVGNVTRLYLHSNLITQLGSASFSAFPYLSVLRVDNNQVQAIERNFFTNLPNLELFSALGNRCIDRELSPQIDVDFEQALEACYRCWVEEESSTTDSGSMLISRIQMTFALLCLLFLLRSF